MRRSFNPLSIDFSGLASAVDAPDDSGSLNYPEVSEPNRNGYFLMSFACLFSAARKKFST